MIKVIETNLSYDINFRNFRLHDHQSRIVEVDSWDEYIEMYKNYSGEACGYFKSSSLIGNSLPKAATIQELDYDEFHLTCRLELFNKSPEIKLAYVCGQ